MFFQCKIKTLLNLKIGDVHCQFMTNCHNIDISTLDIVQTYMLIDVHFGMQNFKMKYLLIGKHFNL